MKKIRLTESQLHRVIKESVNRLLTELDWKTYANVQKEVNKKKEDIHDNKSRSDWTINDWNSVYGARNRNNRFKDAEIDAFNRDYGYDKGDDRVRRRKTYSFEDDPWKGSLYAIHQREDWPISKSLKAPFSGDFYNDYHGTAEDMFGNDTEGLNAYNRAKKELNDYDNGNYEYVKGKGWQLKQ